MNLRRLLATAITVAHCGWLWQTARGSAEEFRLFNDLQKYYNPLERPVRNSSEPLRVTLSVGLQQIVDIDEKNQVVHTNVWLNYKWKDHKLKWSPAEYGGITDIRFPAHGIWKPDVLLYNSVDTAFDSTYPSNLVVYSTGDILWIPPGILKSSCKIDITWFPFDDQNCTLKFGSWTYHGFALNLQQELETGMDLSEYMPNGEWLFMGTQVNRHEKKYDCCVEPYPSLSFHMQIRRRTLYYGMNLIIPSLLISLMTVLGFTLPPEAGEKITLEITILLSVCLFMSIVAEMTPPTSEAVPLIGTFFSCCMLVVSASVVFTVVVLNLHYRSADTHEMGSFVRVILLNWLPWVLCMSRPGHKFSRKTMCSAMEHVLAGGTGDGAMPESESLLGGSTFVDNNNHSMLDASLPPPPPPPLSNAAGAGIYSITSKSAAGGVAAATRKLVSADLESRIHNCLKPYLNNPSNRDYATQATLLMLHKIHMELKFVTRRMEQEDDDEQAANDWRFAAMVVDRLCLIMFSIFIVASTCGIMFSAPHLFA